MSEAIFRERIRRLSPAKIDAREKRQREISRYRAAKRMAKAADHIAGREREREGSQAPQERVSEVLRIFKREYEALTEPEQIRFEAVVKLYVLGRVSLDEWVRVVRSLKAGYQATFPPEPPPGGARIKVKDRAYSPPAGW
jgi:hypothetical protein